MQIKTFCRVQVARQDCNIWLREVLLPRQDGSRRWNDYCRVVGHSNGQLELAVPGESELAIRSLHGLGSGLGTQLLG